MTQHTERETSPQPTTASAGATAASPAKTAVAAVATIPSVPRCTTAIATTLPPIDLDTADPGLTTKADPTWYYQIYGNTATDVVAQIQRCAPGATDSVNAEFTGQTYYHITWSYGMTTTDNVCSVTDVKVGLRMTMSLPNWQAGAAATPGLPSRWNTFMANLLTHEQGHVAIDTRYANQLVTDLTHASCDSAQTTANADMAALNLASDTYDSQTNHGASQGAVLPVY